MHVASSARLRISPQRLWLVAAVSCYVAIFHVSYRDLVAPTFAFFGLSYHPLAAQYFWTSVALCILPSCWMPIAFSRPSLLLFYVQYLIIFIPATFVVHYSIRPEIATTDAVRLVVLMFAGLSIIQLSYKIPVRAISIVRLTPGAFWSLFMAASGIMLAYLVVTLSGNFRLANFVDIYDVRFAMAEMLQATGSRFGYYAQSSLFSFFLPMLFAVGAYSRKYWIVAAVAATYVFLFGIGGAKAAILSLVYLPLVYGLMTQPRNRIPHLFVAGLCVVLLLGFATEALLDRQRNVEFLGVVHFRLFSVPAITVPQYFDFFQQHPVTHLAHVTGFNRLLTYPFEEDIPYTVGRFFYRNAIGMNSGTWAADGLAGFGSWGIIIMSFVVSAVFWVFDSVASSFRVEVVALAIAASALSFGSVSLFTTLITGGLASTIVALLVAPRDPSGMLALPMMLRFRQPPASHPA